MHLPVSNQKYGWRGISIDSLYNISNISVSNKQTVFIEVWHYKICSVVRHVCYLPCYIYTSLHFVQKYVWILVSRRSMFQEASNFLRAMLKGNCEFQGTNYVKGCWCISNYNFWIPVTQFHIVSDKQVTTYSFY